jgi:hypothetical protein
VCLLPQLRLQEVIFQQVTIKSSLYQQGGNRLLKTSFKSIIISIVGFAIILYSCKAQKQASLTLTLNTNFNDTIRNIDLTFYKSKLKNPGNENVWQTSSETGHYYDLKPTTLNTFNLAKVPKGVYTLLICSTIDSSRWCFTFDTVEIKYGRNSRIFTLKLRQYLKSDSL